MTTLDHIRESIPDELKDIRINLGNVLTTDGATGLSELQLTSTAYACALATKNTLLSEATLGLLDSVTDEAKDAYIKAARTAAGLMAMNNVYYRFIHLSEHEALKRMPAKLRMQAIGNPGIEKNDFELMCLAVSAIGGCGMCIKSHIDVLEKHGVSIDAIQSSARIAAVINATAHALSTH